MSQSWLYDTLKLNQFFSTSHHITILLLVLGFARVAILCFGVAEGDKAKECAGGSIVTDFSKPLADDTNVILVKNSGLVIGGENIKKVSKISAIGTSAISVSAKTAGGSIKDLELEKIQLTINQPDSSSNLLAKSDTVADFTIDNFIMDKLSTISGTSGKINVKLTNLTCFDKAQIKKEQLTPQSTVFYITDALTTVSYSLNDNKTTVDTVELPDGTIQKITINAKLGASLTFPTPPPPPKSGSKILREASA